MLILAIGDPHFQPNLLSDAKLFSDKILALIIERKPNFVVVMGDVLHTHEKINTQAMNFALCFFADIAKLCKLYVLVGNHDYINNSQNQTGNHWMTAATGIENVEIVDTIRVVSAQGVSVQDKSEGLLKFVMSPYLPDGTFAISLKKAGIELKETKAVFCHQLFDGAKMGAIEAKGVEVCPSETLVISGHIHDKQQIENLDYIGASFAHAFGDSSSKTVSLYTFESEQSNEKPKHTREDVDLKMPKLKTVKFVLPPDLEVLEQKMAIATASINRFRFVFYGTPLEVKQFRSTPAYTKLKATEIKVVFKQKEEKTEAAEVLRTVSEFRDTFYTSLNERERDLSKKYF